MNLINVRQKCCLGVFLIETYVLLLLLFSGNAFGYGELSHETMADYAAQKSASLETPIFLSPAQRTLLRQGAYDEDIAPRWCFHAFNPINNDGFVGFSNARDEISTRWASMTAAFAAGEFYSGDGSGAWHFLGRSSHLLQDMASPLHSMAVAHVPCYYETYWANNDASLRTILSSSSGPLHSSTLDAQATARLDAFSAGRLQERFDNSGPARNSDDPRGWVDTLVRATYFRATFWGQVTMGSSSGNGSATTATTAATVFSDGTAGPQQNVLHTMFGNGNVRWINSWIGDDYYEITDRNGYVFRWMSMTDIDDWSSCGRSWANGLKDTSARVGGSDDDDDGIRVTGRFWFDLRELGRSTSGSYNRNCFPRYYPDGGAMTEHLHQYLGSYLASLAVRYNAGLLGLANRRVTVNTADSTPAHGFKWGRKDNLGNGPSFDAGPASASFFFVAKSPVTLAAPAANTAGMPFVRWLRDGSPFDGNTNRAIAINGGSLWIPTYGVTYTAEYLVLPQLAGASLGSGLVLSWNTNFPTYMLEYTTNVATGIWISNPVPRSIVGSQFIVTNSATNGAGFYRLKNVTP